MIGSMATAPLLALAASAALAVANIVTYPVPRAILYTHHNDDFTVRVRTPGGEWQDLYEYDVVVDLDRPQHASMVMFDMNGPVEVSIRKNNGTAHAVVVRPTDAGIRTTLRNNIVTFTLAHPVKLSIEFDGDRLHNLHLFANPPETDRPRRGDPDVVWFDAGVHVPPGKPGSPFSFSSNQTVYLAPGAVLQGRLSIDHASNVRIIGRGIIDQPQDNAIQVDFSHNVTIDGPTVIDPKHYSIACGQSDHVVIRNFKTFSAQSWTDGIDMMACSDVDISDAFLRTSDDSIAIYGHRWDYSGDVHDIHVSNAILWADVAHPINIGLHGDPGTGGETIENLSFRNIRVLEHDEDDPDYQGVMAISDGDDNLVRNVLFDNVRVEDFQEGQLVNLRVVYNDKYNTAPGRGIRNVLFRNITYDGANDHVSHIAGYAGGRDIEGVRFENLRINGKLALTPAQANVAIGRFVDGVSFSAGAAPVRRAR